MQTSHFRRLSLTSTASPASFPTTIGTGKAQSKLAKLRKLSKLHKLKRSSRAISKKKKIIKQRKLTRLNKTSKNNTKLKQDKTTHKKDSADTKALKEDHLVMVDHQINSNTSQTTSVLNNLRPSPTNQDQSFEAMSNSSILTLTDDALIEVFRFVVLLDRHSIRSLHGSWNSFAAACPRLSSIYNMFLKTYSIKSDDLQARHKRCTQCNALYDNIFYLSITKLVSPMVRHLIIPPTCYHMQNEMVQAIIDNVPNVHALDCTHVRGPSCDEPDSTQMEALNRLIHQQKAMVSLSICHPTSSLFSSYSSSLASLRRLHLHICTAAVIQNVASFLKLQGHRLNHIKITVKNPPDSHKKSILFVEDTCYDPANPLKEQTFYPVISTLAHQLLLGKAVSEVHVSSDISEMAVACHSNKNCPIRLSGQCDSCSSVDMTNYFADHSHFKRPHVHAHVRGENPFGHHKACIYVPPRPRFIVTSFFDGIAVELRKPAKSRTNGKPYESCSSIVSASPAHAVPLELLLQPPHSLMHVNFNLSRLRTLEIGFESSKFESSKFEYRDKPKIKNRIESILMGLKRARRFLTSLRILYPLNLPNLQTKDVLQNAFNVRVLDLGPHFLLSLYSDNAFRDFFRHFSNLRVLKFDSGENLNSSAILAPIPHVLNAVKTLCPVIDCMVINPDDGLSTLDKCFHPLALGCMHLVKNGKAALHNLYESRPNADFSAVEEFFDEWDHRLDCIIHELTGK